MNPIRRERLSRGSVLTASGDAPVRLYYFLSHALANSYRRNAVDIFGGTTAR